MRVLLVNPPGRLGSTTNREGAAGLGNQYLTEGAFLYPPHTLATVAAVLREAGHQPALLDATAEQLGIDESIQRIRDMAPEGIGVLLSWAGWDGDLEFYRSLKESFPTIPLVAVGAILRQETWAEQAAQVSDFVLVGEPELAFAPAIERAISRQGQWGEVVTADNLAPAHYDGRGYLLDIESLPTPAWDLTLTDRYRMLTVLGSRGCDAGCRYCPYVIGWGDRFRACSSLRVVDELLWLAQQFRPARIMFRDPVFGYDRRRVVEICEELLRRGVPVAWECESRPEHFDADLLRLMRQAGCTTVKIGLESGDPARLVSLGRIADEDSVDRYLGSVREAVQTCRQIALRCQLFVMGGWEDADASELENTSAFVRELAPAHLSVKRMESYPGAPWNETYPDTNEEATEELKRRLMPLVVPESGKQLPLWRRGMSWLSRRLSGKTKHA